MMEGEREDSPVQKENLHIDVVPVFMKKIFQEIGNWLQCNMPTHNNMSEIIKKNIYFFYKLETRKTLLFSIQIFCKRTYGED